MKFFRYGLITMLAIATDPNNCAQRRSAALASPETVPFELRDDLPLVRARVNGVEFVLILDSGSGMMVLDTAAAREAHIRVPSAGTISGRTSGRPTTADSVNLGRATVYDALVGIVDMTPIQRRVGFDVRGAIGYDLFERYVVTVDYPAKTISLSEPMGYHPDSGATSLSMRLVSRSPVVPTWIETRAHGVLPAELIVDLGSAAYAIRLSRPFLGRYAIESDTATLPIQLGVSLKGIERGALLRVPAVRIGDARFPRPSVALSMEPHGILGDLQNTDGTIGAGIFRRTRVTFDYAHGRVYLARTAPTPAGDSVDASGLVLEHPDSTSSRWMIQEVVPGSAAEAADLAVGDELILVDGNPVASSALDDLRERLRQSGAPCVVVVRRGDVTIRRVMQLRALVP